MWDLIVSVPDHCLSFCFGVRNDFYFHLCNLNWLGYWLGCKVVESRMAVFI